MNTLIHTLARRAATCMLALAAAGSLHAQGMGANGLPMNPNAVPPANGYGGYNANGPMGQGGNAGNSNGNGSDMLDQLMAWERQDMGVRATSGLHNGAMHGPTPNSIPGGQVITTKGLLPLLQQGMQVLVFDALGGGQALPNAIPAAWTAQPGSFDDGTQQQMALMLRQLTRGNNATPLVFYCGGPQCWMSYNASVRAIQLGYRNVLWYRGGLEAWQRAGLQLAQAQQQGMPQQMSQPMPGQQPGGYPNPGQGGAYPGGYAGGQPRM